MTDPALSAQNTPDWSAGIRPFVTPSVLQYALAALMTAIATVISNKILTVNNLDDAAKLTQSVVQNLFSVQAVIIRPVADDLAMISGTAALSASEQKAALHSANTGEVLIGGQYPFATSRFDFHPAGHGSETRAVIGFSFEYEERPEDLRVYMDMVAALFACIIDRFRVTSSGFGAGNS